MKLNRKRKDARFPNWILELLASLQIKYQWTFTEALIRCAEKGAAYYNKQWMKMHPNQKGPSEEEPSIETEELSDPRHNNTPKETVTNEELDNLFEESTERMIKRANKTISDEELKALLADD